MRVLKKATAVVLTVVMCLTAVPAMGQAVSGAGKKEGKDLTTVNVPLIVFGAGVVSKPATKGMNLPKGGSVVVPVKVSKQGSLLMTIHTQGESVTAQLYKDSGCTTSVSEKLSVPDRTTEYPKIDKALATTYYLKVTNPGTQSADVDVTFYSTPMYSYSLAEGSFAYCSGYYGEKESYVTFNIKKRCSIYPFIDAYYYRVIQDDADLDIDLVKYYIQKYSTKTKKWYKVTSTLDNNNNKQGRSLALSKGSYRFVAKSMTPLISFWYNLYVHKSKYATTKKKAITVAKKKKKDNILTATESKSKAHWYKIKLKKKQKVKVSCFGAVSDGGIRIQLRTSKGKNVKGYTLNKTNTKAAYAGTATTPDENENSYQIASYTDKFYQVSAKSFTTKKLKKGTYYIRVTKTTKTGSGNYGFSWK